MNIEKLKELKLSMEELEREKEMLQFKQKLFNTENKSLIDRISDLNNNISECKGVLKENAEAGYFKDSVKKRLGGIGIRCSKVLEYDEKRAFLWAKEKDLCLMLNKKEFEGFAKSGNLDFVELKEKVIVTFPKVIKEDF